MRLTLFARIWLTGQDHQTVDHFIDAIPTATPVVECRGDFLLRVVTADLNDYRRFQGECLARIKRVQSVNTEVPMQKVKLSTELPI